MFFVLLSTIKAQRRLIRMMKKALIFTLAVLVVLLAGCGVMPADEKESATQSQTVSFPAEMCIRDRSERSKAEIVLADSRTLQCGSIVLYIYPGRS